MFYSGIGHLFNKKLRYKCQRNKCSTLVAKTSLDIVRKYNLENALFATGSDFAENLGQSLANENERINNVSK